MGHWVRSEQITKVPKNAITPQDSGWIQQDTCTYYRRIVPGTIVHDGACPPEIPDHPTSPNCCCYCVTVWTRKCVDSSSSSSEIPPPSSSSSSSSSEISSSSSIPSSSSSETPSSSSETPSSSSETPSSSSETPSSSSTTPESSSVVPPSSSATPGSSSVVPGSSSSNSGSSSTVPGSSSTVPGSSSGAPTSSSGSSGTSYYWYVNWDSTWDCNLSSWGSYIAGTPFSSLTPPGTGGGNIPWAYVGVTQPCVATCQRYLNYGTSPANPSTNPPDALTLGQPDGCCGSSSLIISSSS